MHEYHYRYRAAKQSEIQVQNTRNPQVKVHLQQIPGIYNVMGQQKNNINDYFTHWHKKFPEKI